MKDLSILNFHQNSLISTQNFIQTHLENNTCNSCLGYSRMNSANKYALVKPTFGFKLYGKTSTNNKIMIADYKTYLRTRGIAKKNFLNNYNIICSCKHNITNYKKTLHVGIDNKGFLDDLRIVNKPGQVQTFLYSSTPGISYEDECNINNCPFQDTVQSKSYTLVSGGCLIRDVPTNINESIGWNKGGHTKIPDKLVIHTCKDISGLIQITKTNTKLNIRGGGHSYNNSSLEGGTVITFPYVLNNTFHNIELQFGVQNGVNKPMLYMGSRVRLGDVYVFLHNYRTQNNTSYDFPGGSCPNVGIAGYLLGGGQSFIGAYTGPGCHYLYGVKCVTADGTYKTYNESSDADVMYIIRGAGHSKPFIVTTFIFDLTGLESKLWECMLLSHNFKNTIDDQKKIQTIINKFNDLQTMPYLAPVNITSAIDGSNNSYVSTITVSFLTYGQAKSNNCDNIKNKSIVKNDFLNDASWVKLLCTTDYLYELYNTELGADKCAWGGTITTMWEWGDNPNATNIHDYAVNRTWSSIMGTNLGSKVSTNSLAHFIGLDHYVNLPGPYANNSIYPPYKNFKGWVAQAYTQNQSALDNNEATGNKIEESLKTLLINSSTTEKQYKYSNYPPTYKLDNIFNSLKLYFNTSDISKVKKIKKKLDAKNKFVSEFSD